MFFQLAILLFAFAVYKYYQFTTFWSRKGVSNSKPLPIVGNIGKVLFGIKGLAYVIDDYYKSYPTHRYVGFHMAQTPFLMVKDPDLLKQIFVKEFEVFPEHREVIPQNVDSLWNKNLFTMRGGKQWQDMRAILSPSFTSSKMKMMYELIKECCKNTSAYYLAQEKFLTLNMKDTFLKYSNDVITSTAFGVSCNTLVNPKNDFFLNGLNLVNFKGLQALKMLLFPMFPSLMKALKFKVFSKSSSIFFTNVIKETLRYRQENSVYRPDMIQLLTKAQTEEVKKDANNTTQFTEEDFVAQALVFYFGGLDTTSTMMSYAAYELAVNPDIQSKLREEVDNTLEKCQGEIPYEALMEMKYLDMVLSETLRKWPPFTLADRRSIKSFTIEPKNDNEKLLHLEAGQHIAIPTYSIHRDPKYYPQPEKFDPERFSEENKHKIVPYTYIPFGAGPRNCIAARYALLQGKLILTELISKFEFVPVEKTIIPLKFSRFASNPIVQNDIWLGVKRR